jgi:hypothetical protein
MGSEGHVLVISTWLKYNFAALLFPRRASTGEQLLSATILKSMWIQRKLIED